MPVGVFSGFLAGHGLNDMFAFHDTFAVRVSGALATAATSRRPTRGRCRLRTVGSLKPPPDERRSDGAGSASGGRKGRRRRTELDVDGSAGKQAPEVVEPDMIEGSSRRGPGGSSDTVEAEFKDVEEGKHRRARIILEIVNAGEELEEKINKYKEDIDEELLEMMYSRIKLSSEYGEKEEVVKSLVTLWRRLRSELERQKATPAMRLLDDALCMMTPGTGGKLEDRIEMVTDRLESAFSGPQSIPVDIFGVAQALAGGEEPPEEFTQEFVSQTDFIREVEALLVDAKQGQEQMLEEFQNMQAKVREVGETSEEGRVIQEEVGLLRKALKERELSMEEVEEILEIARAIVVDL